MYHLYDFRDRYEIPDLSPKSFQAVSNRFLVDEAYALKYLNVDYSYKRCNETCRKNVFCITSFSETKELHDACINKSYDALVNSIRR